MSILVSDIWHSITANEQGVAMVGNLKFVRRNRCLAFC